MTQENKPINGLVKITDDEFNRLVKFVHTRYGIDLSKKRILIEGRLSYTLKEKGLSSFHEYLDLLQKDNSGSEITILLNKITTNHSYFARENEHFEFLQQKVLPFFEKRRPNKELRIWSAGCSAGQEAYNIAMTIDQYFGSQKSMWDTRILATDISMNVLSKAKQGIYPANNLEGLPGAWKQQYFKSIGNDNYQINEKIRKEVIFKTLNLMEPFHFKKPMDIIFCRNVMIYFDKATTNNLINKYYQVTAPGGFLFIGHSEVIDKAQTQYHYIKPAIYQKEAR